MTKYAVDIYTAEEEWETLALFSDKVNLQAMIAFATEQFELGNSLTAPAKNIIVLDLDTAEILWDWVDAQEEYEEPADVDYEIGYDPYMGCFSDDC